MITDPWDGVVTEGLLNRRNCVALNVLFEENPIFGIRTALFPYTSTQDTFYWIPMTATRVNTIVIDGGEDCMIFFSGTSGTTHIVTLMESWANIDDTSMQAAGVCPAFASGWLDTVAALPHLFFTKFKNVYLIGHSYGGAIAQAGAIALRSFGYKTLRIWTYGSPRPGNRTMQGLLGQMENTRFFGDDDPVRYIPPHEDEAPALCYLTPRAIVDGCNTQVQARTGWQIDATGHITEYEGQATVLAPVSMNIAGWCAEKHGFRSVFHGLPIYISRFNVNHINNYQNKPPIKPNPLGAPTELNSGRRRFYDELAIQELRADAVSTTGASASYVVPQLPVDSPLRYKRKKEGAIWVVDYAGYTVAVGPGKRKATQLARRWNRAARAYALASA